MSAPTMPALDEEKVNTFLAALTLPDEIERLETRFGFDSTGDPATWITAHVRSDIRIGPSQLERLTGFLSGVTRSLLDANISSFPYTRLEQAD